jgi:hypothetical protein
MASTPASRKAKGRRFQQEIAFRIGKLLGMDVGQDERIASREMGQSGTDIRLIGRAKELFPFSIECKNQESWGIHSWISQAKANLEKDTHWLLFCKRNRQKPVVIMDTETFFELYEQLLDTDED